MLLTVLPRRRDLSFQKSRQEDNNVSASSTLEPAKHKTHKTEEDPPRTCETLIIWQASVMSLGGGLDVEEPAVSSLEYSEAEVIYLP